MSIKCKATLIIGSFFIFLLFGQIVIHRLVIIPGYEGIEKRQAISGAQSVVDAIINEIEHLDALCHDWAAWDDTYGFIKDKNKKYINRNLIAESFETMKINHFYAFDETGRLVLGRNYDLNLKKFITPSEISDDFFKRKNLLVVRAGNGKVEKKDKITGIFLTDKYPVLIAARPILTSGFKGPARGTLVMGRVFDDAMMKRLYSITTIKFRIYHVRPSVMNDRLRSIIFKLSGDKKDKFYIETGRKMSSDSLLSREEAILCSY